MVILALLACGKEMPKLCIFVHNARRCLLPTLSSLDALDSPTFERNKIVKNGATLICVVNHCARKINKACTPLYTSLCCLIYVKTKDLNHQKIICGWRRMG